MIIRIPKTTYYHKWFIGATLVVPVLPLTAQTSPNLVFIMADQYRGDALGCLGKEPVKTPCLDHLASEGVLFTNAVSSYPVSSPARAMLMTGMYPLHNKVTGNCNSQTAPYGVELPQEALTRELAALFIQDVQIGERDGKTGAQEIKIDWLI